MKRNNFWIVWGASSALIATAANLPAQETNQVEQLQRQLREIRRQSDQQQRVIESLEDQIQRLAPDAAPPEPPPDAARPQAWSPADPIRLLGNNRAFINVSLDGLFAAGASTAEDVEELQPGGHDPNQRGFTLQNLELTLDGMVDPYFRGQANVVYQIDTEGESFLEVEEGYLETLSLPANLQVKAGQYLTEFGRLNPTHPHAWSFVDQPLVNGRLLGEDGLRNLGARLSWLAPTPFYSELLFSAQNSHGETAASFRNDNEDEPLFGRLVEAGAVHAVNDLLFAPRYAASFDLTDAQTVVLGASGAFGPNSTGRGADTQIYGADVYWKWRPADHSKGFPFVSWQTEAMLRRYDAARFDWDLDGDGLLDADEEADADGDGVPDVLPGERLTDWGCYSQVLWGFRTGWVAGLRGDYVTGERADYEARFGDDPDRADRWRLSPSLTYYPSEYSKLRLQYNYDDREDLGEDHSVWLQFEFLLGAHAAHRF